MTKKDGLCCCTTSKFGHRHATGMGVKVSSTSHGGEPFCDITPWKRTLVHHFKLRNTSPEISHRFGKFLSIHWEGTFLSNSS